MIWKHKNTFTIGGLQNVGYAAQSDIVMVLSSQGQGIFNCRNGEKIARLHNDMNWVGFDDVTNTVAGFDCLQDQVINTSGLYGGDCLSKISNDGWELTAEPRHAAKGGISDYPSTHIILTQSTTMAKMKVAEDGACELRAFGFSDTYMSFIVATSCELIIYSR